MKIDSTVYRAFIRFSCYVFVIIVTGTLLLFLAHRPLLKILIEYNLNRSAGEAFRHSLKIGDVRLDRDLKIRIQSLNGLLHTEEEAVPFEIRTLRSENPVTDFFFESGLSLVADGICFKNSERQKINGTLWLRGGLQPEFVIKINLKKLELDEISWINPGNLSGLTGKLQGKLILRTSFPEELSLKLKLNVDAPGGHLRARTFEPFLSYLPESLQREYVKELTENPSSFIRYEDAAFELDLSYSDRMKIFLHMTVPDYNLILNIKIELRLDKENAFLHLLKLLNLINAKGKS